MAIRDKAKTSILGLRSTVKTQLTSKISSRDTAFSELNALNKQRMDKVRTYNSLLSAIDSLKTDITKGEADSEINELQGKLDTLSSQIDSLQIQVANKNSEVEGLNSDIRKLRAKANGLKEGLMSLGVRKEEIGE